MAQSEISDHRMTITRVEALSDGAFSIALTLLVLRITIPQIPPSEPPANLISGLLAQWPVYFSYVLTFITLGTVWISHHQMLKYINAVDYRFQMLNLVMLMFITLSPFTAGLLGDYLRDYEKLKIAAFVYGLGWLLQGGCIALMWLYARRARLLKPSVSPLTLQRTTIGFVGGTVFGTVAMLLSVFAPYVSLVIYVLIGVAYALMPGRIFQGELA